MNPAITTVALIVGDLTTNKADAIRLLFELRYFVENRNDSDPIIVIIDGSEWRQILPDDLLVAPWLTVIVLDTASDLPAVLANRAMTEVKTNWVSFCWPGTEISTWYANKAELLQGAIARHANIVAGYRGSGEARLKAVNSTESHLTHPVDSFSSDYPHAWLQMLDLVSMANALLSSDLVRQLGFAENPALQRCFWWDFTLRASTIGKIDGLPLQPIPVHSWHRYTFAKPLAVPTDNAIRLMMAISAKHSEHRWRDDPLWKKLPSSLRQKLKITRKANNGKGLRVTVLGGVNEPAHNQLCFFNFFELIHHWGVFTWRCILDETAHPIDLAQSDVVIFSRVKSANGRLLIDFCRTHRIPTIYMLDDNWFWLGREWPEYEPLFTPGKPVFENFMYCMKNAELVLTYNQQLADDLAPYAKQVVMLPTNVDLTCFPRRERADQTGHGQHITIGYVGSIRKNSEPFQAIVEIARARKDVNVFVMSNILPDELLTLPTGRVTFQPYQFNYAAYAALVCCVAPDVLIAPVGRNRFEASKCPNKYFEIAACGAAGVYSSAPPYLDFIRENENGLLANDDIESWRSQIERLINNQPLRREIAKRAISDVESRFDTRAVLPTFLTMLLNVSAKATVEPVSVLRFSLRHYLIQKWHALWKR